MKSNTISTSVYYQLLNMANTIKFLHLTRIYFQILGIWPTKPNHKYSFNATSFFILLSMTLIIISTTLFFFNAAETMQEYLHSFYISTTELSFVFYFVINIWKISGILELIGKYEEFVEKLESKVYEVEWIEKSIIRIQNVFNRRSFIG